jgi:hypothetical protein
MPVIPALRGLRQKEYEFNTSLAITKPSLKIKKKIIYF